MGAEILYVSGVSMYKISLLFLYFRVFPVRSIRLGGYLCGGLSTAWTLACIGVAIFRCIPLSKRWEPWLQGNCIDLFLTQLCASILNILCALAILCLPVPHVYRLQMSRPQRILITIVFLLGSYAVFTSVYRFYASLLYRADDVSCKSHCPLWPCRFGVPLTPKPMHRDISQAMRLERHRDR